MIHIGDDIGYSIRRRINNASRYIIQHKLWREVDTGLFNNVEPVVWDDIGASILRECCRSGVL